MAGRKLAIHFGPLNIAARSEVAIEKTRTDMKNVCLGQPGKDEHDATPMTMPKTCAKCGPITDFTVLKKGIKTSDGYALVEQEDVAEAKEEYVKEYKHVLSLVAHPAQQFLNNTAPGDSLHFLTPEDATHEGNYQLLVKLIESHPELSFAGLYTPQSATNLFTVRVRDGVLVMEKRVRSQSVKATPSVGGVVDDRWYAAMDGALPTFVTDYDADAYEDKFETALADMLTKAEVVSIDGTKVAAPAAVNNDEVLAKLQALAKKATKAKATKRTTKKEAA